MYLFEVLKACDEKALIEEFLKLCKDSPDTEQTKASFTGFLKSIKELMPNITNDAVIYAERVQGADKSECDNVYARLGGRPERYGLVSRPWADTLGYKADGQSVEAYGYETFTALVMFEMTWFGFDEEVRKKNMNSLHQR